MTDHCRGTQESFPFVFPPEHKLFTVYHVLGGLSIDTLPKIGGQNST